VFRVEGRNTLPPCQSGRTDTSRSYLLMFCRRPLIFRPVERLDNLLKSTADQ
jgi:hypothetical protein